MRVDMAMPMYSLFESANEHHRVDHYRENAQNIAQDNAMVRVTNLELDSWDFASLWMLVRSRCTCEDESQLTYMPTIRPINTVFKQAIVAVMRFLTVCHSLAIGRRW
jgi:hypothetical protein